MAQRHIIRLLLLALCTFLILHSVKADLEAFDEDDNSDILEESDAGDGDDYSFDEGFELLDEEPVREDDVVVLCSSNFTEFIASNHFVMVEFYAPWCGHCQSLAPEYAAAATELKSVDVFLAKVDATEEPELSQKYGVQGYPTIFFFVDGQAKPYSQQRTREAIVTWVKKKVGPAVFNLSSVEDAKIVLENNDTIVMALFDELKGIDVEEFSSAARQEETLMFYQTQSRDVAEIFNINKDQKAPVIVVIKNATEKVVHFDGQFERSLISEFVLANKLPLVSAFNKKSSSSILESPIKRQLILFGSAESVKEVYSDFEEAAKSFKGKIIFVHVDSSDEDVGKPVVDFFGVTGEKPTIIAFLAAEERPIKFLFEEEFTTQKIKDFATGFLDGKLKEFYKSEPVPESNDGDVKVVVGKNFDEIVLDESKDVLLEIYAPWCGHCQSFEPVYNKLGRVLRDVDSIVIAKMDGTTNEHPRAKPDGFPTILFFPAGNKSFDPLTVETDRTVKALYKFLKKNAAIPFSIPKSKNAESDTKQSEGHIQKPTDGSPEVSHETKDEL